MKQQYSYNPITSIERLFNEQFNLLPIFHDLEEVYRTGDTVRFYQDDKGMSIDIDIPGATKADTDMKVDTNSRDVYITATRTIRDHQGEKKQTLNRSFTIGSEFDLTSLTAKQENGVLSVSVPRKKKDTYIRKVDIA